MPVTYVLDTNFVSRLMRGDESAIKHLTTIPRNAAVLPQPVIAEVEYGLARLPMSARANRLRNRFDAILRELGRARWTDAVSRSFGGIKADLERRGQRLEDFDIAIAAHATVDDETRLVTGNTKQMRRIRNLRLQEW